jgi:hypothetical protein
MMYCIALYCIVIYYGARAYTLSSQVFSNGFDVNESGDQ